MWRLRGGVGTDVGIDREKLVGATATGPKVVQGWATQSASAEEVTGLDKHTAVVAPVDERHRGNPEN